MKTHILVGHQLKWSPTETYQTTKSVRTVDEDGWTKYVRRPATISTTRLIGRRPVYQPINGLQLLLEQNREHNRETLKSWNSEASASMSTGRYNPLTKQV